MQVPLQILCFPLLFSPLVAQETSTAPPASAPVASAVQVSNGPGAAFQFTKIDLALLNEANAVDAQYEAKGLVFHDPDVQAFLDSVGARVLANRPVPEKVTYRFMVLRDPVVNAFSLPNGSVYITTGLLALLENEAQLAGVLGHETAHVYERHSYIENRSIRKKNVAIAIIAAAANLAPGGAVYGLAAAAAAEVSSLIVVETVYGYSRDLERQADRDGLIAMTAARYDPHAMAVAFELLDQDRTLEYEPTPTFYHDHPKLVERRSDALAFADANTPSGAKTGSKQDYLVALAPAIRSNIDTDIQSRRLRTAVARATRLAEAFKDNPQDQILLGESYRELGAKTVNPTQDELTHDGEAKQRKELLKMTEDQEQQDLLSTPEGRATLKKNRDTAENLFLSVIQNHPDYAIAYRELGFLYEDEARFADAATQYQHYLMLVASTSLDRLRIERRLALVQNRQNPSEH